MIENIKEHLKNYFENENYLDDEYGYTRDARGVDWMASNLLPRIENLIDKNIHKNCLDVGCAQGYFTRKLDNYFNLTYGIDFSENRIGYAKKYESDKLKFIAADLTENIKDKLNEKFDFMFTNAVIPHIPAQFKANVFTNLAEVANPGCLFVIYDGMVDEGVENKFDYWTPENHITVALFSKEWLEKNAIDWEIISIEHLSINTEEIILKRK